MDEHETLVLGNPNKNSLDISAIIYVTSNRTPQVMLEQYDKMVDALNSVQTAKSQGIVAGGGVTYWRLSELL